MALWKRKRLFHKRLGDKRQKRIRYMILVMYEISQRNDLQSPNNCNLFRVKVLAKKASKNYVDL